MKREQSYVQDRAGNCVAGAEIYVRKQSDNSLVTLYTDNGVTTTANPLVTDNDGEYAFYTANETLKVQCFVDGVQAQEVTHFQHYDLSVVSTFAWTMLEGSDAGTIRTTLGVGTGDSPQFTALNIGHASDTTITRVSAGVLAIEGSNILTASAIGSSVQAYNASTTNRLIALFFTTTPTADEVLCLYTAAESITLADDFAGSVGDCGTNPTSSFVLDVQKNGSSVGSITIGTDGSFTFATAGGGVSLVTGDLVKIVAPSSPDATVANVSITLKGTI